jgi:uncharacterized protein
MIQFIENRISAEKVKKVFLRKLILITITLCLLNLSSLAQTKQFPGYTAHINDFANVIDSATKSQIETILINFENLSGAQIAVAVIPSLEGGTIEEYANGLYRAWGIGGKSGPNKDKGALLVIAIEDRRSRLEVGYGLEGDLPDGLAGEMLRRMRPYFQQQQWSQGVTVGVRTIVDTLAQKWNLSIEGIDRSYSYSGSGRGRTESRGRSSNTIIYILLGIFILFIISRINRRGGGGGRRGRRLNNGMWLWPLIFHNGGGSFGGGSTGGGGSDWSGFGGSSSSDSGGGGGGSDWGGFDGGSSGGGGASDSW